MFRYLAIVSVVVALLVAASPVSACNGVVTANPVFSFNAGYGVGAQAFVAPQYGFGGVQAFAAPVYAQPFVVRQRFFRQRVVVPGAAVIVPRRPLVQLNLGW